MKELKSLYNGIMNDYSIRRYTLGWETIVQKIERRYKTIVRTDEQFQSSLLHNAINACKGSLQKDIIAFAKEIDINMQTLREKSNTGTQRSPFGIGS